MYSNQGQSGLWPDVNTEYAWKKYTQNAVVGHQTSPGPTMQVPLRLFEDKNPSPGLIYQLRRRPPTFPGLTRSYVSLRHHLSTPLAAVSSLLLGLPLTLSLPLLSGGEEGGGGGAPSPGCPFVSHPSIVTIFYLHHHAASFLLWGDWCVRADRDALYLSNRVPGEDRRVMLCRMTDSDA